MDVLPLMCNLTSFKTEHLDHMLFVLPKKILTGYLTTSKQNLWDRCFGMTIPVVLSSEKPLLINVYDHYLVGRPTLEQSSCGVEVKLKKRQTCSTQHDTTTTMLDNGAVFLRFDFLQTSSRCGWAAQSLSRLTTEDLSCPCGQQQQQVFQLSLDPEHPDIHQSPFIRGKHDL